MDEEAKRYLENVDSWIKQIRADYSRIIDYGNLVEENVTNTQHNYELIYKLKDEIDILKEEMRVIKLMQLLQLKKGIKKV